MFPCMPDLSFNKGRILGLVGKMGCQLSELSAESPRHPTLCEAGTY